MFVKEIMSTCVSECTEDMELAQVYELIRQCEHGLAVVIESNAHRVPIGIVSERSICEQIILRGRNPRGLRAASVIDSRIKTVMENDLVEAVIGRDRDADVSAVVVINGNRQVCGLVPKQAFDGARSLQNIPTQVVEKKDPSVRSPGVSEIPAFGWIQ